MEMPLSAYLALSLFIFTIGAFGVVVRRSPVVIFMCIEMMFNAVNLSFLAFARYVPSILVGQEHLVQSAMAGQMTVIFVMAIAAAEVAVGLGIIMAIYRLRKETDVDEMSALKG